jgi:hypothetical protein
MNTSISHINNIKHLLRNFLINRFARNNLPMKNLTFITLAAYIILITWVALSDNASLTEQKIDSKSSNEFVANEEDTKKDSACIDYAKRGCKYRH